MTLDDLIDRFDSGAVVTANPHALESGEAYRWELKIDGEPAPDVFAHERHVPNRPDQRILVMVCDDLEVELARWSVKRYRYGPGIVWTLGGPTATPRLSAQSVRKRPKTGRDDQAAPEQLFSVNLLGKTLLARSVLTPPPGY